MIIVNDKDTFIEVWPGMNRVLIEAVTSAKVGGTATSQTLNLTIEQAQELVDYLPYIIELASGKALSVYSHQDSSGPATT